MNLPDLDSSILDAIPASRDLTAEDPSSGLDCGPMSGFNNAAVDRELFVGTRIQSNFICSLGYGKPDTPFPRNPPLSFEEAGRWP